MPASSVRPIAPATKPKIAQTMMSRAVNFVLPPWPDHTAIWAARPGHAPALPGFFGHDTIRPFSGLGSHAAPSELGLLARRKTPRSAPEGPSAAHSGDMAAKLPERALWGTGRARHRHPSPCLAVERMVQPGRFARHRHPVLSRASAADAARAAPDP